MLRNLSRFFNRITQKIHDLITPASPVPSVAPKPILQPEPVLDNKKTIPEILPPSPFDFPEELPIVPPNSPKNRPKKTARSVIPYQKNITAALALPVEQEDLTELQKTPEALFEICKDHVKEHASMRVDIYFYLLVAVYNTHLSFKQGETILQHGKGRKTTERQNATHACHSNLFPTLVHPENEMKESIFANTHFFDTMNLTFELPVFVNQLDMILEGKIKNPSVFRKSSLDILQNVSDGKYDPIEGLKLFLEKARKTLHLLESDNGRATNYLSRKTGAAKQIKIQLLNFVKKGTFFEKKAEDLNPYFQLLLRLKPEEIAECKKNPEVQKKIYQEKMENIKNEILTTKSFAPHKIQKKVI